MWMISESALLSIWEQSQSNPGSDWCQSLLCVVFPGIPPTAFAALGIVQRDRLLLEIRRALFGPELPCSVACPGCSERLEWTVSATDLGLPERSGTIRLTGLASPLRVASVAGEQIRFRDPTFEDVAACRAAPDAERALVNRCLLPRSGAEQPDADDALLRRIASTWYDAASAALPVFDLECPDCARSFTTALDVARYLAEELGRWARRLFETVHRLARAYGWTESEILALSPARRVTYLHMVQS